MRLLTGKSVHTHYLCDERHEQRVQGYVQVLLDAEDNTAAESVRPCDVQKIIRTLKFGKACGLEDIPNECLGHLPRRPLVHLTHLFNHCFRLSYIPAALKEAKVIVLPKPGKDPKFPPNLQPISLLSTTGKLFEKVIQKLIQSHL